MDLMFFDVKNRKKQLMAGAGTNELQVFTDFEHSITKFNLDDGSKSP